MKKMGKIMTNLILVVIGISLAVNLISQIRTVINAKSLVANMEGKLDKLNEENGKLVRRIREMETPEEKDRLYRQVLGWGTEEDYWIEN
ncbi:MAG: hypothetical protein WCV93_05395 [Candidatus Shapirobacteria bacterium]|jgi:predicted thioredoxin/glutaredoxin